MKAGTLINKPKFRLDYKCGPIDFKLEIVFPKVTFIAFVKDKTVYYALKNIFL